MGKAGVCCCTEQIPGLERLQEKRTKMQMKWKKFETADKRPIADRLFCIKKSFNIDLLSRSSFSCLFFFFLSTTHWPLFPGFPTQASEIITYRALFHEWDYGFLFVQMEHEA